MEWDWEGGRGGGGGGGGTPLFFRFYSKTPGSKKVGPLRNKFLPNKTKRRNSSLFLRTDLIIK